MLLDGIEEMAEYGVGSGSRVNRYDHDVTHVDALLAQLADSAGPKSRVVADALGSVYGMVDGGGAEVTRYGYDVYGARSAAVEGVATSWGFTGRSSSSDAGMYYRQRYYSSLWGAFTSEDAFNYRLDQDFNTATARLSTSIRSARGLDDSRYQYVLSAPTHFTDPLGLAALDSFSARIVALLAAGAYEEAATLMTTMGLGPMAQGRLVEQVVRTVGQVGTGGAVLAGRIISTMGTAAYRVPDVFDKAMRLMVEVKFVETCNLYLSRQLVDLSAFALNNGYRLIIAARNIGAMPTTLKNEIARIPGAAIVEISELATAPFWITLYNKLP